MPAYFLEICPGGRSRVAEGKEINLSIAGLGGSASDHVELWSKLWQARRRTEAADLANKTPPVSWKIWRVPMEDAPASIIRFFVADRVGGVELVEESGGAIRGLCTHEPRPLCAASKADDEGESGGSKCLYHGGPEGSYYWQEPAQECTGDGVFIWRPLICPEGDQFPKAVHSLRRLQEQARRLGAGRIRNAYSRPRWESRQYSVNGGYQERVFFMSRDRQLWFADMFLADGHPDDDGAWAYSFVDGDNAWTKADPRDHPSELFSRASLLFGWTPPGGAPSGRPYRRVLEAAIQGCSESAAELCRGIARGKYPRERTGGVIEATGSHRSRGDALSDAVTLWALNTADEALRAVMKSSEAGAAG